MKKSVKICWICLMVVFLFLPYPLWLMFSPAITDDDPTGEGRPLAVWPGEETPLSDYPGAVTSYVEDHLPFRSQLITANNSIDMYAFHESEIGKVIVGKNNFLYFNSETEGDPLADYTGENLLTEEELAGICADLTATSDELKARGTTLVFLFIPNKSTVYPEYMPDRYGEHADPSCMQQIEDYLRANSDLVIIDPTEAMLAQKAEDEDNGTCKDIYFRYDTHWNHRGAYVTAGVLLDELCGVKAADLADLEQAPMGYAADLERLIKMTDVLGEDTEYQLSGYVDRTPEILEYHIFSEPDSKILRLMTDREEGDTLVIKCDSFSGFYYYMAGAFKYTYVATHDNYDLPLIQTTKPKYLIWESAERYLPERLLAWDETSPLAEEGK